MENIGNIFNSVSFIKIIKSPLNPLLFIEFSKWYFRILILVIFKWAYFFIIWIPSSISKWRMARLLYKPHRCNNCSFSSFSFSRRNFWILLWWLWACCCCCLLALLFRWKMFNLWHRRNRRRGIMMKFYINSIC